ncbi:MAG: GAF domain-containing protein, partial [Myxococcota bacterium]|nr:GAF domain-containing protein [Myxococcota bacterium]
DEDPETLRAAAVDAAAELLGAGKTSLVLLDEEAGEGRVAACHGRKESPDELGPVRLGEGVAGAALARGEPLLVRDLASDPRFGERRASGRYESGSFVLAPLQAATRTLGVLCATDRSGGEPFEEEDLALLRILATQLALLEAGRGASAGSAEEAPGGDAAGDLHAELAREICDAVTREVEPGRILHAALAPVARALDAAPVSLHLVDVHTGDLGREAEDDGGRRADRGRLPAGRGLTGGVLETGQLVASDDPAADPRFDAAVDTPADGEAGPLLCGPLRFRGKTLGVFRVFPKSAPEPRTGEVLSAALSAAVRNVLLYRSLVQSIEEVADARRAAARSGPPRGASGAGGS